MRVSLPALTTRSSVVPPTHRTKRPAVISARMQPAAKRQRLSGLTAPRAEAQKPRAPRLTDCFAPALSFPTSQRSPLHLAVFKNRFDDVRKLLEAGADANARDSNGATPLHYAAELDHIHMLEILLRHGADPYAMDSMGDTPMHGAAAMRRSGTALLLAQTMQNDGKPLPAWPQAPTVHAALRHFKSQRQDANTYTATDRLIHAITGTAQDLNNDFDVLKYIGHLLDLDKAVVGDTAAQGWNQVAFFYQRLRSYVHIYLHPKPLPETLRPVLAEREVKTLLKREIVGILTSLNVMRHVRDLCRLNEPARDAVALAVAQQVVGHVGQLQLGEGFTLPLGLPTHAIYMNLMPDRVDGQDVVTFRLDNLGLGAEVAASRDKLGRVMPFTFNLPGAYVHSAVGQKRLVELLAKLFHYLGDPQTGIDMVYAQITLLLRELHGSYPTSLIDAVEQSKYARDPQTVGNCSLKNHSAGVWTRLSMAVEQKMPDASAEVQESQGAALWYWLKEQEIEQTLRRMHEFVITPKALLYRYEQKKADELRTLLGRPHRDANAVREFLQQPLRQKVAEQLSDDDLTDLIDRGHVDDLTTLLQHGLSLDNAADAAGNTLLHRAVRSESPRSAAMVQLLLAHGADPQAQDKQGRTPFLLAAHLGRTPLVQVLMDTADETQRQQAHRMMVQQVMAVQDALQQMALPTNGATTPSAPAP